MPVHTVAFMATWGEKKLSGVGQVTGAFGMPGLSQIARFSPRAAVVSAQQAQAMDKERFQLEKKADLHRGPGDSTRIYSAHTQDTHPRTQDGGRRVQSSFSASECSVAFDRRCSVAGKWRAFDIFAVVLDCCTAKKLGFTCRVEQIVACFMFLSALGYLSQYQRSTAVSPVRVYVTFRHLFRPRSDLICDAE